MHLYLKIFDFHIRFLTPYLTKLYNNNEYVNQVLLKRQPTLALIFFIFKQTNCFSIVFTLLFFCFHI